MEWKINKKERKHSLTTQNYDKNVTKTHYNGHYTHYMHYNANITNIANVCNALFDEF